MNTNQATINRDAGIKRSATNSEIVKRGWQKDALNVLRDYISINTLPFLAEDVRLYAEISQFPIPPSKRAWGAVFVKAYRMGLIKSVGYKRTSNPLAHATPATLWMRKVS